MFIQIKHIIYLKSLWTWILYREFKRTKIKEYDFFISHSSKDSFSVQKLIVYENQQGNNVFCDWISDADYLKRNLMCDATLRVIEKDYFNQKHLFLLNQRIQKILYGVNMSWIIFATR